MPDLLVLRFQWEQDGLAREETYGPWTAADDEAHLPAIAGFITGWRAATGIRPWSVTISVLADPARWMEDRQLIAVPPGKPAPVGGRLSGAVCPSCRTMISVRSGDVTGLSLDELVDAASAAAAAQADAGLCGAHTDIQVGVPG